VASESIIIGGKNTQIRRGRGSRSTPEHYTRLNIKAKGFGELGGAGKKTSAEKRRKKLA